MTEYSSSLTSYDSGVATVEVVIGRDNVELFVSAGTDDESDTLLSARMVLVWENAWSIASIIPLVAASAYDGFRS